MTSLASRLSLWPSALGNNAKTIRRLALGMGGQAIISAFNFAVSVTLIKTLPAEDYGLYAMVVMLAGLATAVDGALVCGPLTVYGTRRHGRPSRAAVETLLASVHLLILAAIFPIIVAIAVFVAPGSFAVDIAFGVYVVAIVARNYSRSYAQARQRPDAALAGDVTLVVLAVAMIGAQLLLADTLRLTFVLHALAISNAMAMCLDLYLLRLSPRITLRRRSLRHYRPIWHHMRWALIGSTSTTAQAQAHGLAVTTFSGPAALAPLAAGQVLFGPLRLLLVVWHSIMQPELVVAITRNDRRTVVRTLQLSMLALGTVVVGLGIAMVAFWDVVFTQLYAAKYADAPMAWITAGCFAIILCASLAAPASGVLQTLLQYRLLAQGTVYGSIIGLATAVGLLFWLGPAWSLLGVLAAEMFALCFNLTNAVRMLNRWRDGTLPGQRHADAAT
jgi:hypothetical protein